MANPRESSGRLIHPQTLGDGRSQYRCRLKNPTCVFGTAPPKPFGVGNVPKPEFSGRLKKWPYMFLTIQYLELSTSWDGVGGEGRTHQ